MLRRFRGVFVAHVDAIRRPRIAKAKRMAALRLRDQRAFAGEFNADDAHTVAGEPALTLGNDLRTAPDPPAL